MQGDEDDVIPVESGEEALVVQDESALPTVTPDPATLVRVFRLLRDRIPGYTQLSQDEERSMIRAAHLDPEMISSGILTADAWEKTKLFTGMTAEEIRALDREIREWEPTIIELTVLLRGLIGANRKRKYRRGKAILSLYSALQREIQYSQAGSEQMLPYYEMMQRAYMKNRKTRRKAKKDEEPGKPEQPEE
jgi:hypothetical protein